MSCWQIRQLISSYIDNEITPEQRRVVDEHLASCVECRETMAAYHRIGSRLKQSPEICPPVELRRQVLSRASEQRNRQPSYVPSVLSGVRTMVTVAVVLMMAVGIVAFWQQGYSGQVAPPAVAGTPGQPYNVPTQAVVKVSFDRPMDTKSVEQAIVVQPAIALKFRWDQNTLEVSPAGTLDPNTVYTITVSSKAEDNKGNHLQQPLTVALHTVDEERPPASASGATQAQATEEATQTATGTASAAESATSVTTGEPTQVADNTNPVQAVIIVEPTVAGTASPDDRPEASPTASSGRVVASGSTTKVPERSTGTAKPKSSPSSGSTTAGKSHTPATSTATPPSGATATAGIAMATAVPTASPVPTEEISPTPVITSPADCQFQIAEEFHDLANDHEEAVAKLECATADARDVEATIQRFQGGSMFSLDSQPIVYVIHSDGTWSKYQVDLASSSVLTVTDTITPTGVTTPTKIASPTGTGTLTATATLTTTEGFDTSGDETPDNMFIPTGAFGAVWRAVPSVKQDLGWATEEEHSAGGRMQEFANGQIVQVDEEGIYILDNAGASTYEDLAPPATATAAEPTKTPDTKPSQKDTATPAKTPDTRPSQGETATPAS